MTPRILGVLDVKGGVVVRGVGGRRAEYRPLPGAPSPLEAARTMGVREVYLADLDAIEGAAPALAVYRALAAEFRLWVDAGVRTADDRARLSGPWRTVVGLETAESPAAIHPGDCFSIDLRDGRPLGRWGDDVMAIARTAVAAGARTLLVLDLARVGGGGGTGTEALCAALRAAHPGVELLAGGGVRNRDDLKRLAAAGVGAALVGTALRELIA